MSYIRTPTYYISSHRDMYPNMYCLWKYFSDVLVLKLLRGNNYLIIAVFIITKSEIATPMRLDAPTAPTRSTLQCSSATRWPTGATERDNAATEATSPKIAHQSSARISSPNAQMGNSLDILCFHSLSCECSHAACMQMDYPNKHCLSTVF